MISVEWYYDRMILTKKFAKEIEVDEVAICIPLEYKSACFIYELSRYTHVEPVKLDDYSTKGAAVKWLEEKGIKIVKKREAIETEYFLDCAAVLSRIAERAGKGKIKVVELTKTGEDHLRKLKTYVKAISLDSSVLKGVGENTYGTAYGLLDALLRLNVFLPGKKIKIVGYGRVGRGCASLLRSLGCDVVVWDTSPERRIEALYNGFKISKTFDVDIVVTCTGNAGCLGEDEIKDLPNGCILLNLGAEKEIDPVGEVVVSYGMVKKYKHDNKYYYLIADGYAANLALGDGTPIEVMDRTFSASILALNHIKRADFSGIQPLPKYIEEIILREAESLLK